MEKISDIKLHEKYMKKAIKLALKGLGETRINPLVGCVIVKNQKIIAKGYHKKLGDLHAEAHAIKRAKTSVKGADLYVTLEPCSHFGLQAPCADLIIKSKIKRVFIGSSDPNPLVLGAGIKKLKEAGIEVFEGVLKEKCDKINRSFFYHITHKIPYVVAKYGMSLDGVFSIKALCKENSFITSKKARDDAHKLREKFSAIMVGINTIIADNPILNCRTNPNHLLYRIIVDSNLKIPLDSNVLNISKNSPTIVVCTNLADKEKAKKLKDIGALIIFAGDNKVDLKSMLKQLYEIKIDSILLEGGNTLLSSFLEENLVNEVYAYIAHKMIKSSKKFKLNKIKKLENDTLIRLEDVN